MSKPSRTAPCSPLMSRHNDPMESVFVEDSTYSSSSLFVLPSSFKLKFTEDEAVLTDDDLVTRLQLYRLVSFPKLDERLNFIVSSLSPNFTIQTRDPFKLFDRFQQTEYEEDEFKNRPAPKCNDFFQNTLCVDSDAYIPWLEEMDDDQMDQSSAMDEEAVEDVAAVQRAAVQRVRRRPSERITKKKLAKKIVDKYGTGTTSEKAVRLE
ncbi:hypothetical protein LXL04_038072 [Taraxacum kok-saghyz]